MRTQRVDPRSAHPINLKRLERQSLIMPKKESRSCTYALKELKFHTLTDRTFHNFRKPEDPRGQNKGILG